MKTRLVFRACCYVALAGAASMALAASPAFNLVTGLDAGTYAQMGKDLSTYVAEPASLNMRALVSSGSADNIRRLRDESGTRLALVQADVLHAFKEQAAKGNAEAARLVAPLRVVLPLHDEEIYVVVRADSPMTTIRDIANQRINIGPIGGGTAMTAATLYPLLFDQPLPADKVSTFSHEEAMLKLATKQGVDVVVIVAGQPAPLFLGMEPGVEKYFKLLRLNTADESLRAALAVYPSRRVQQTSYPFWLTENIETLSVKSLLVTFDYTQAATQQALVRFAESLCGNLSQLQREGHPMWQEVSTQLKPLSLGWRYYAPTEAVLQRCAAAQAKPLRLCPLKEKIMGFCKDDQAAVLPQNSPGSTRPRSERAAGS